LSLRHRAEYSPIAVKETSRSLNRIVLQSFRL
jgi:hypothetical protein